ncbi:hypothetical protein ALP29_200354 [Pseudomonas syringae pv. avii]|uniref:Uncharacterized protein n=1 Tax=Pseudomonas syringae pv. avii TaxID=663959 RepID=A0A3M5W3E8_PSESX|nr:hypothetical protein ALP29_200354 [Pseudomonas syringae pv. avii]
MRRRAVLEVIVQTFLFAQALNEVQIRFVVLHAVFAFGVRRTGMEAKGIGQQAMVLQYLLDDLRHRQLLKGALIGAMSKPGQMRA